MPLSAPNTSPAYLSFASAYVNGIANPLPNNTQYNSLPLTFTVDNGNYQDPLDNTYFVIPKGISYCQICGYCDFTANGTGIRYVELNVNASSTTEYLYNTAAGDAANDTIFNLGSGVVPVSEGDKISLSLYQNSGGTLECDIYMSLIGYS